METSTIPDGVAARIQADILGGRFDPGSALPPQRELAQSLGVSRASLREAVVILETLGFVRIIPGKGVFVADRQGQDGDDLKSGEVARTYQLRYALEPFVAGLVATTATDELIRELTDIHAGMEAAIHQMDLVKTAQYDAAFHRRILDACENPMFAEVLRPVMGRFMASLRLPFANRSVVDAALGEHERVLQQIRGRSPSGAIEAMQRHILGAGHRTGNLFRRP